MRTGDPVFAPDGGLSDGVTWRDLANFVFYKETGEPLPSEKRDATPLLGTSAGGGTAVHLIPAEGAAPDAPAREAVGHLTRATLAALPAFAGTRVVYARSCRIGAAALARAGVTFRQVPYALEDVR